VWIQTDEVITSVSKKVESMIGSTSNHSSTLFKFETSLQ
jgi:hypothetical protein